MADLREMIAALTTTVPLPEGLNTATTAVGIDARGDVLVYVPPDVEEFQAEGAPFLSLSGGTMTGPLILANATPTQPLEAASKAYVDASIGSVLNSPNFTGIPTAPTAVVTTSNNQIATTAFVHAAVAAGGTFVDAPADGFDYGRRNNNWDRVLPLAGGGTLTANPLLRFSDVAGTARPIIWSTNLSTRWQLSIATGPESGNNADADLALYAYADNGSYIGSAIAINRASGPLGLGPPYIYNLAAWRQQGVRTSEPNGVVGNLQQVGAQDRSPVMPLPANCLAVTANSPVVTITWPGASGGDHPWISDPQFGTNTWINLQGATEVGGITPSGWLMVTTVIDGNTFTVNWTQNATATATGGGAAMTAQPSHVTTLNRVQSQITSGGSGFPVQTAELYDCQPDFLPLQGDPNAPRYEHRWHWSVGPNDPTGIYNWSLSGIEWDLTNRGHDWGYQPNIYAANNPTSAFWIGPVVVPAWATGGGQVINWGAVYTVFSGQNDQEVVGVYQAFTAQPNSLVGQKYDPTGHGGVGVDLYGAFDRIPYNNPFSTTLGSSHVTVRVWPGSIVGMSAGDMVTIVKSYTINGVTFGAGDYQIFPPIDPVGGFFDIIGLGNATATGSGGGNVDNNVFFHALAPYAPMQLWGLFQHGIITNPNSEIASGAIIETQPGNAIQWSDGFGAAWVTAAVATPGVVNLVLSATASVEVAGSLFTSGTNPIQAGQAGSGNSVTLRPGAMGTGYADVTSGGIDANVDLRLIAAGTGTVRVMSPLTLVGGISGSFGLQPGNAITWSDGTGTASISATATTAGNLGIRLAPAGTGLVTMAAPLTIVPGPSPVGPQVTLDCSTVTSWAQVQFILNPANNNAARLYSQRGGVGRWNLFVGDTDPESGSSSGCNFQIQGVLDNGTTIPGTPALKIIRATNQVNMGGSLNVTGTVTTSGVTSSGGILATGTNSVQVGQPGVGNNLLFAPGAPGTGYATISVGGIDGNVDLRLVALGTGTVRAISPVTLVSGIAGPLQLQAGQPLRWSDGTNVSTISVAAGANADLTLAPAGSGRIVTPANQLMIWGSPGAENSLDIRGGAGQFKTIYLRTGATTRWTITSDANPESGGNANSNLSIGRFSDAGAFLGSAMNFNRATGNVTLPNSIGINGAAAPGRPIVTGSRTDGTALASLLAALVSFGMITDSTTA